MSRRDVTYDDYREENDSLYYTEEVIVKERLTFKDKLNNFKLFLWNNERKQFMGRDGASWAKIGLFYFCFYTILAIFFALLLLIFWAILDKRIPPYSNTSSVMARQAIDGKIIGVSPGLGFRPQMNVDTTLIRVKSSEKNVLNPNNYVQYVNTLNQFLSFYYTSDKRGEQIINCDHLSNEQELEKQFSANKVCRFEVVEMLGANNMCTQTRNFEYDKSKPCILLKLNKIYNWKPEAYQPSDPLPDELKPYESVVRANPRNVFVLCDGEFLVDKDFIGSVKYFSRTPDGSGESNIGFIPFYYFPFKNQDGYRSPLVFAYFHNITTNVLINVMYAMADLASSGSALGLRQSKSEPNIWNAILAIDARYNHYRFTNSQFRKLYIKRRSQLIRDKIKSSSHTEPSNSSKTNRLDYFNMRSQLLKQKYDISDQMSVNSQSLKLSKAQSVESNPFKYNLNKKYSAIYSSKTSLNSDNSFKLNQQRSLDENYAFAGVYHIFDHHKADVTRVKFANNDKSLLATCSLDCTLAICQVIPSPASVIYKLEGHKDGIVDMQWSSTNDLIVTASLDGTARVWQITKGRCMRVIQDNSGSQVLTCCFQPLNENMIVTGNSKGLIQVYNLSTGIIVNKNCLQKVNGKILSMCFDSTGGCLWVGDNKGTISSFQFDMFTLKLNKSRKVVNNSGYSITSLSYRTWLTKDLSEPTILANAAPNYLLLYRVLTVDGQTLRLRKRVCIKQSEDTIIHSSFCPIISQHDNVCVVCTGNEDACVYLYDMERDDRPLVNRLQGHSTTVLDVCFNYDESLMASGDKQGTVIIWRRENNVKNII